MMAGEIIAPKGTIGGTAYAQVRNESGQIWNTSGTPAFEVYNAANVADYDIALTEQGASGTFVGNLPTLPRGIYFIEARMRAGGSPAESDTVFAAGTIRWTGSAEEGVADVDSGGVVEANVLAISGDSGAADNLETAFDGGSYNVGGGAVVAASVTGAVGSVAGNVSGNVAGSVASVTAGVSLADDAITSAKFDESTAFPVRSADTGSTQIARVGADGDTLETLSDQLDAKASQASVDTIDGIVDSILVDTGTDIPATLATLATAANLATVAGYLDTEIAAILEDTGTTIPAQITSAFTEIKGAGWDSATDTLEKIRDASGGSAPSVNDIVAGVSAMVIETGYDLNDALKLILSTTCCQLQVTGNTNTFFAPDGSTQRVVSTTNAEGDRSSVTLTP